MALPVALTGPAGQIVDKAMTSRGSVTTTTDYSSISDAFMKKASLETQIGGMLMDQNMQRAQLMGELDMHKADLYMQNAQLAQNEAHFQQQRKDAKDADKMSPFEQITGVLAGAAAPAAAGFAIGGPPGAVIGGLAGGAMTASAGNSRSRQQNMIQNIGTISKGAMAIKGFSDHGKAVDGATTFQKGLELIGGELRSQDPTVRAGAEEKLDTLISEYTTSQLKANRPMGEVYKEAQGFRDYATGNSTSGSSRSAGMQKQNDMNWEVTEAISEAQSDEAFMRGDRKAVKAFGMKLSGIHMKYGEDIPTDAQMKVYTHQASPEVQQSYFSGKSVSAIPASGGGNVNSQGGSGGTQKQLDLTDGPSTMQAARPPADSGLAVPNYIVPSAAPAGSRSGAWGMEPDVDSGPQRVLQSASENFNQAAFKDPTLIDKAMNRPTDEGEPQRKPGGGLIDRILPMSQYEKDMAVKEGRVSTVAAKETPEAQAELRIKKDAEYQAKYDAMPADKKVYFTSTDPVEIHKAIVGDKQLDVGSGEKLKMAAALSAPPAQMNEVKKEWGEFGKKHLDNLTPEQEVAAVKAFEISRYAMGGKSGDLNMESTGGGIAAGGVQAHFQTFKTNYEMQLEKGGTLPSDEKLRAMYDDFIALDSKTTSLQASMAKSNMGGQLSDRDVSMYMLRSVADPNDFRIRDTIEAHQSMQYQQAKALILNWGAPKGSGGGGGAKKDDELSWMD